jgi:acyl carrier protein
MKENNMQTNELNACVKEMIAQTLSIDEKEIDAAQPLSNYGLNSIDLIDIVVKLESKFQVRFDPKTMKDLTVNSLVNNIETAIAAH